MRHHPIGCVREGRGSRRSAWFASHLGRRPLILLLVAMLALGRDLPPTVFGGGGGTVGTGDPASCTDAALTGALAAGGMVTFNCGILPLTIAVTSEKVITMNTNLVGPTTMGTSRITLSGGGANRLFRVDGSGLLELNNLILTDGYSGAADGGAIYTLNGSVVLNNSTVQNSQTSTTGADPFLGGGIYANYLTLMNSTLQGNTAKFGGGSYAYTVNLTNSSIHGNVAGNNNGGLVIENGGTISSSQFSNNTPGALYLGNSSTTSLNNVMFQGNTAGGVIVTGSGSTVDLNDVTITGNFNPFDTLFDMVGVTNILRTTITGNTAGGGLFNIGTLSIVDSTISENTLPVGGFYGTIHNQNMMNVTNSTIAGNNNGGIDQLAGQVVLKNTILSENGGAGNCRLRTANPSVITSAGFNLSDDASCAAYFSQTGDLNNTPAGLGPLADNGGTTLTHRPLPGSIVIDHGTNMGCPSTDQRGLPRPVNGVCDIGAVEIQSGELPTLTPSLTATVTRTPTSSATHTPTSTSSGTPTRTATATGTPASTPTATATVPPSATPTVTQLAPTSTQPPPIATSTQVSTSTPPTATPTLNLLNRITVFRQDGAGGLYAAGAVLAGETLPLPAGGLATTDITFGDFTGDGAPDLLAVGVNDEGAGRRVLYPNLGQGQLGSPTVIPQPGTPVAIAVADVNQSGPLDLAIAAGSGAVSRVDYVADGALGGTTQTFTIGEPVALALGRFTDDSQPDLAVATAESGSVQIQRQAPATGMVQESCPVGGVPRALAVGRSALGAAPDLDLDLFVALPNGVLVLENSIAAGPPPVGFCTLGASLTLGSGLDVRDLVITDLNADGRADVIALVSSPPSLVTYLANPTTGYGPGQSTALAPNPVALAVGPLAAGGGFLVVVAHAPTGTPLPGMDRLPSGPGPEGMVPNGSASLLTGGAGSFMLAQSIPLTCGAQPRLSVAAQDLNGDGRGDVAVAGCLPAATPITPTPTVTMTRTPNPLGGQGFNLETSVGAPVVARWSPGTGQTGYRGLRTVPGGSHASVAYPSFADALPPAAASFTDFFPVDLACYLVFVLGGAPPNSAELGRSDALCRIGGQARAPAPGAFNIRLQQTNTAILSWNPPVGGQTGYQVLIIPTDGSGITSVSPPVGQTSYVHDTGGRITCYMIVVQGGGAGQTDALCAIPGVATGVGQAGVAPSRAADYARPGIA